MAHSGTPVAEGTAHAPINHREPIATISPLSSSPTRTDSSAVVVEDQELFRHAAILGKRLGVLALLADGRVSCDLPDHVGCTPLHWAAYRGHRNVVLAMLRAGARVGPHNLCKDTPMMMAASRGHEDVVEVLLDYSANESDCWPLNRHRRGIGHWRSTALHCAAAGGHEGVVRRLFDAGFDREQQDGAGLTPAEVSAKQSHSTSAAITRLLLPANDMGGKLVHAHVAMTMEDVAIVSGLVKGGAFLDWQDGAGDTPLFRAVGFRYVPISRLLLQAGADPNLRNHTDVSPLHIAVLMGCREIVADLLEAGADTEPVVDDFSPLHLAVVTKREDVVSLLLNAGASMEHCDPSHGLTPLSWACNGCLAPIVRMLVGAGADVESSSSARLTPLHWACRFIDADSVEVLLNAGADPGAVDQAAANDAVVKSSSGTIVSMPVAIDVIGLGYPLDGMEDSSQSVAGGSETLADRRLDLVSVQRIQLALQGAKQERSWRRRGWLVILANRWVATNLVPGNRDERAAAVCRRCFIGAFHPAVMQLRHADTGVEQPPCAHQKEAASNRVDANANRESSDSQHPQEELSNGQDVAGKKPRTVRSVGMTTRSASRRQGQMRGGNGSQANMAVSLPELVDALLGLAVVEVGVFRTVVMFI